MSKRDRLDQAAKILVRILSLLSIGISSALYVRVQSERWYLSGLSYGSKLFAGAFSPAVAVSGTVAAILGVLLKAPVTAIAAGIGAALSARYVQRVTASHTGFESAFGVTWQTRLPRDWEIRMLRRRWMWGQIPTLPPARCEKDVAFGRVPGTDRQLLCDVWRPEPRVEPSGLAVIYLHGGGWQSLDKGYRTDPFFRYLTAQGHAVVDVAYRLCPETDMAGMLGDAKRAIAWVKANGERYAMDAERVVLAGGSAGGHLALLVGYTPNHPQLDPVDLAEADTSVRGLVSYYGLTDLRRWKTTEGDSNEDFSARLSKKLGFAGAGRHRYLDRTELALGLFGGLPRDVPEVLALMSPITHVGPHCPPTLLFQGSHDHITPLNDVQNLYGALVASGVPAIYVELPQVEHAFDMLALPISPPAQAALYDVERFLALML